MTDTSNPPPSGPSLVETRSPAVRRPGRWRISNIIDGRALRVKLTTAAQNNLGDQPAARKAALNHLHAALFRGRMIAQERLQQGADGLDTARLLAAVQDEVISALYDFTTTHVFRARNPTEAERLAVLATGGYGRGVMAPSSDTDLLFLRAYKVSPHTESVIEYMLYAMWDMGLKVGHAFRTPNECVKLAAEDVTIKTSMLDARFICGDEVLADDMFDLFQKEAVKGKDAQFIADKLAERDARHTRHGDARYVVEPNIKEGKGGLRDLQTLYWITKHMYGGVTLEDVMKKGPFTDHEYAVFIRAAKFLWTVRCHLHFVTGRPEERLGFDLQPEIASRMGYRDRGEQQGVERFMKRYFLIAKDVGGLTRILAAKLEADHKKKPEGLRRFLPVRAPQALKDKGFTIDNGRINVANETVMETDPLNMLRLFTIARREGKDIHPEALTALTRNLHGMNDTVRELPEARRLVLESIMGGERPGQVLRWMNESGLLGRVMPEFGGIVAQTQFNMYHHYTVDEHTIRAVEFIAEMEHGRGDRVALVSEIFPQLENRRALYLAMLLHDTGKGKGDQQIEGTKTSYRACQRLGIPEAESELVAWLVGHHLEMSETAQKRDISDPRTVATFADLVGSLERLQLLYILTVADIKAVGPAVWNAWKGQLLADLYNNTAAALRGGRTDEASVVAELEARAERRREALVERMSTVPAIMLEMETAYWTGFDLDDLAWQADVLAAGADTVAHRYLPDGGAVAMIVSGQDRTGLFADLAGTLARLGANVASAQVFTSVSGRIVDIFMLQDGHKGAFAAGDPGRIERLEAAMRDALAGNPITGEVKTRTGRREAAFLVQPSVQIRDDQSADYSVIDIAGRNRPGLLHEVADVLADMKLSIHSAHVGSYGERVFDAFYVQNARGQKISTKARKETLRERLLAVLGREEPDAPHTPARKLKRSRAVDSF
ncbi:[protein-PII] uridylyltransferase [Hyphomonas johnsonii]|uniref:Bifunctional uridylyltransferase/uridylyl-removing enzyme n=1 Tax=Hyphomonas johnsonii MHS-2 TaxID=1280950 RepID=A0A059FJS9_9PROT|nr:[protein-PII] uridylyltransferase [Hyphomonas johnsonii]KCZ90791.1 PII uridylyl-transferase [Hyphomonas johnsonii MHS-2]